MSSPSPTPSGLAERSSLEILTSRHFPDWLDQLRISLAFSTYQTGKLFLVGLGEAGRPSVFERTFNRCMGLWSNGQSLWLASAFELWRLENVLRGDETLDGFDRLYVPRMGYITGDVDVHDIAVDADGRVAFISTLFSCLATTSERDNFSPLWRPPFISKLAAEDRCHLNGLAMQDGRPRYVTACSQTDIVDGWRDHRADGGCIVDIESNEVVATGLSMPHSPRVYRDRLWVLDSGTGYFGYVDLASGAFERVTFCPGYPRGLAFVDKYAVIALSRPRHEPTFAGLPLEANLAKHNATPHSGLQVVDLDNGDVVHWLRVGGVVEELYDVVVLPGVRRPKALGFKTDEIRHNVWREEDGRSMRWTGASK